MIFSGKARLTRKKLKKDTLITLYFKDEKVSKIVEGNWYLFKGERENFFKRGYGYSKPVSLEKMDDAEFHLYKYGETLGEVLEEFITNEYITCESDSNITIFLNALGETSKLRKAFNQIQG